MAAECLWVGFQASSSLIRGNKNRGKLRSRIGATARSRPASHAPIAARCASAGLIILGVCFVAACGAQQPVQLASSPPAQRSPRAAEAPPKDRLDQPSPQDKARTTPTSVADAPAPKARSQTPPEQNQTSPRQPTTEPAADKLAAQAQPAKAPNDPPSGATSDSSPYDPLSPLNEKILAFNVYFDDHVGRPAGTAWAWAVPYQARVHIRNFFRNTGEPKNFVNCLLQGRFRDANITLERFSINTTLGGAGFFDVAQNWFGLERQATDFGLTAAHHSVKYGPYLMSPVGGPTSLRDAAGTAVDGHFNPLSVMVYVLPSLAYLPISAGLGLIDAINERSLNLETFDDVDRYTVDLYGAVQDGYYQKRGQGKAATGPAQ
jgi:phospholipid-binding lipoprotein MlaA